MSKKSHFLMLWPWPLTYDLAKFIRSRHYHYQCVYQIWEQSIPWFLSYRVNTIAGGGRRLAGGGRLRRKTITSPDPSDTGDIITHSIIKHTFPTTKIQSKWKVTHDFVIAIVIYAKLSEIYWHTEDINNPEPNIILSISWQFKVKFSLSSLFWHILII